MPENNLRGKFRLALRPMPIRADDGMRPPTAADDERLGALMYDAYLGTIDYEGESEEQALEEVRGTLGGKYGPVMWSASRVVERGGIFASAILVTRWEDRPIVAYVMTHPDFKRQGLARACFECAVNQLLADGERELWLASTLANVAGMNLYQSLGFEAAH